MPRWRKDSIFGYGPRQPLDRERRARFRFLIRAHRGANQEPPPGDVQRRQPMKTTRTAIFGIPAVLLATTAHAQKPMVNPGQGVAGGSVSYRASSMP